MVQSVKHLTLGVGSGHDLMVPGMEPRVGLCTDSTEPAWILSLPLSLPLPTLKINKSFFLKKEKVHCYRINVCPPKFIHQNLVPKGDGIRRWDLDEVKKAEPS